MLVIESLKKRCTGIYHTVLVPLPAYIHHAALGALTNTSCHVASQIPMNREYAERRPRSYGLLSRVRRNVLVRNDDFRPPSPLPLVQKMQKRQVRLSINLTPMGYRFTVPCWLPKFVVCAVLFLFVSTVRATAAELDGVTMPDTQDVAGVHLVLNGLALRTYSFLQIHIYVAGLYLQHRSTDPEAILKSTEPKLLRFVFQRDINAENARKSWREGLGTNCRSPCQLPSEMVDRFLAAVPTVQKGDIGILQFTSQGLDIFNNGQRLGQISDPTFVRVILSTFLGIYPATPALKRGLLGASR